MGCSFNLVQGGSNIQTNPMLLIEKSSKLVKQRIN